MDENLIEEYFLATGKVLKMIREEKQISQKELADFIHKDESHINLIESGKYDFDMQDFLNILLRLNITPINFGRALEKYVKDQSLNR